MYQGSRSRYLTAQVCLRGHVITDTVEIGPARVSRFCDECGAPTITQCPSCQTNIRGYYDIPGAIIESRYTPPAYCYSCGKPFPWTEERLSAARELIQMSDILEEQKADLEKDLVALMVETPRTKVAVAKIGAFLRRTSREVASAMRDILVDIACETVRKQLGL